MKNPQLAVLMPCLNEAETIARCIQKAKYGLKTLGVDGEIIVADNGSSDNSVSIAEYLNVKVVSEPKKGYGAALMAGIRAASAPYIIIGDSDDSYDFTNLRHFYDKLLDGYHLVVGNRFAGEIKRGAMPLMNRYLGSPLITHLGNRLFKCNIGDFNCGIRAFKKDSILNLNLEAKGMEFASAMIIKATQSRLRITEVPTILRKAGRTRPPHLRPWQDGWRHLKCMLDHRTIKGTPD